MFGPYWSSSGHNYSVSSTICIGIWKVRASTLGMAACLDRTDHPQDIRILHKCKRITLTLVFFFMFAPLSVSYLNFYKNKFNILMWPCVVICLSNENQQDALFSSQFISVINLYMFRAGLQLVTRKYFSVYTAIGIFFFFALMLAGC